MRNWYNVLPPMVACAQRQYERRQTAIRMRACGVSVSAIAAKLGCHSYSAAHALSIRFKKVYGGYNQSPRVRDLLKEISPLELYLRDDVDVRRLLTARRNV